MPDDNKIAGIPLVEDWRNWKRWWSMRLIALAAFLSAIPPAWQALPPEHVANLPSWIPAAVSACAFLTNILTGAARVIRQAPEGDTQ
jgi:hypothetical protein